MTTKTVTVKFVNQPKEGRKQGSIKLSDESFMGVPPELLSQFQPGGTYEIEYSSQQGKGQWEGTQFHTINRIIKSIAGDGQTKSSPADDHRNEHIFVCGGFNHAIAAGQVNARDDLDGCIKTVANLREAYRRTFGNKLSSEINDDIPY